MPDVVPFGKLFEVPLRNGVSYASKERGSGIPMVNMKEIFEYDRIRDQECELAPLTDKELETSLLQDGDLLFARQSLTYEGAGRCVLVLPWPGSRTWESHLIRVRLDKRVACPGFYFYYFKSSIGRRSIESIVQQVAAAGIRGSELAKLAVPLPPLEEQGAIAEVLGALDDKIAANTKLATTVDEFLSAKFAQELEGAYQTVPLDVVADVNAESVRPAAGGELRYIDIASVSVGSHQYPERMSWADAPGRARRKVKRGDTLWSTVRPNRRSHSLNLSNDSDLVASTGLAVISPRRTGFAYLYEVTRLPEFTSYLENVAEGSAYPAVRADRFASAPVPLLGEDQRCEFERLAAPMREHVHSLGEENRALAATRDALLPQLMSGKLRVKDVDKALESVV